MLAVTATRLDNLHYDFSLLQFNALVKDIFISCIALKQRHFFICVTKALLKKFPFQSIPCRFSIIHLYHL